MSKPYEFREVQQLVSDAVAAAQPRHRLWEQLEHLYRYGTVDSFDPSRLAGTIWGLMDDDQLETFNVVLPRMALQIAQLTARDPRPTAIPLAGGQPAEQAARAAEAICEYYWNRAGGTSTLRDGVQDYVVLGNMVMKVDWSYVETEAELDPDEVAEMVEEAVALETIAAYTEGREAASEDEIRKYAPLTESIVIEDEPYIEYVRPPDLLVPDTARRLDKSPWVALRITMSKADVEERFPGKTVVATGLSGADLVGRDRSLNVANSDEVVIYEFWDQRTRTLTVLQLDSDEPLFEGPWPYDHRYLPFVHAANHKARPSDFWGFGDLELLAPVQEHLRTVWTKVVDSLHSSGRKFVARRGALDDDAIDALSSDEDNVVAMVDVEEGTDVATVVQAVMRQPMAADVSNAHGVLMGLLDIVGASNDFENGGMGADRMSATAAAMAGGVQETRVADKQLAIEEAASRVFTLILLLAQENLDAPTAIRIAGPSGATWEDLSADNLVGEFAVRVETGSMNGRSRASRVQEGQNILTQVVPLLGSLGYSTDGFVRKAIRLMGYDPEEIGLQLAAPEEAPAPAGPPQLGPGPAQGELTASDQMALLGGEPMAAQSLGELSI